MPASGVVADWQLAASTVVARNGTNWVERGRQPSHPDGDIRPQKEVTRVLDSQEFFTA